MRRVLAYWLACLIWVPGIAAAGDVKLGAWSRLGYDSNVFNREDATGSAVWGNTVFLSAEDELERGSYKASYEPTFFWNEAAKNTWNQRGVVEGTYLFSPRTSVHASNDFAYLEKLVLESEVTPDPTDSNIVDSSRKTIRNATNMSFNHSLTRRTSFYAVADYTIYRFQRSEDEDSDVISGYTGLNYALTQQLTVGGGGQYSYRTLDAESNRSGDCGGLQGPGSRTRSYSGFLTVAYQYDEFTSGTVRAGPARVETVDYQCDVLQSVFVRRDVNQTTWFAQGELLRRWTPTLDTSLRYKRAEGFGGVGTTTINDDLIARLNWKPARFWNVSLRAGWLQRTQDAPRNPSTQVKSTNDTTVWTIAGSVGYQLMRRLRATVDVSYRQQIADTSVSNPLNAPPNLIPRSRGEDFEAVRAFAGIRYEFDPIRY